MAEGSTPRAVGSVPGSAASAWRARYAAIDAALDASTTRPPQATQGGGRDALKGEIVGLFKAVEGEIAELSALKEDIRKLVDKWKSLAAATPTNAPQFIGEAPLVHADHLGASTFIEKGWSRISLGDYEGAETALHKALELSPNDPQSESLLGWAGARQLAEAPGIGRDGDDDFRLRPRKARKRVVALRLHEQVAREHKVARVGDDGEAARVEAVRGVGLRVREGRAAGDEDRRRQAQRASQPRWLQANGRYATRGGAPPSSTTFNSSAQRLPHGLNLFAAKPSRHACLASSSCPLNHIARPSS